MTTEKTTPVEQVVENMEPNWPGMFRYAVHIVKLSLPENFPDKGPGQQVVVEMLEFGKRLYEASAAKGAEIERLKAELDEARIAEKAEADRAAFIADRYSRQGEEIERLKANLHTAQTISGERLEIIRFAETRYRAATKVNRKDK